MSGVSLGWGIIGIGNIVKGTIAPAMVGESSCELVAAVSRDNARAKDFATAFGARYAYTDYEEMLANPAVDAVFIATPNGLHADQVVAAALAGKHVLCDKPLAINVPDAFRAVEACQQAGVKLGVNFHNRHLQWVADVSGLIGDGTIGTVQVVELEVSSGVRTWDNWRADRGMAGLGSIHNVGVHGLDFLRVILRAEPVEVMAMFDRPATSDVVESLGLVLIRFDNGTLAYCNFNESVANPVNELRIFGSTGRMIGRGFTRSRIDGDLTILTGSSERRTDYPAPDAHRLSVVAFTVAVLSGEEPNASGLDGLRSAQLCDAIERSVNERRLVEVDYGHPAGAA